MHKPNLIPRTVEAADLPDGGLEFKLLFEESSEVLLVLLPDAPRFTMIAATNARWRATHTTAETLGRGLFEVFPDNPDDPTASGTSNLRASFERVLKTRQPDTMPVQKYDIRGPDGEFQARYWSPKNLPVLSPQGEVLYILHRVEDVTELVRASEVGEKLRDQQSATEREVIQRSRELAAALSEVRESHAKLAELDIAKTAFFSNISHEFRTPLTLMLGSLEDVLGERGQKLPAAQREHLETAHRNALRLLNLVNALLDFARIEAGRMRAHYQPTNLSELTAELASSFDSATERARLKLTIDCPPLPESIYVDREMWEKIVLNLISNAFKYTMKGGIAVCLDWVEGGAQLTVADTGTGIAAEEIPRLFERFHRIEGAPSRAHEGTGIGLSLVRELVQLHAGSIKVESELGKGSRFIVTVKPGTAHLPADQIAKSGEESAGKSRCAAGYGEQALSWIPQLSDTVLMPALAESPAPRPSPAPPPREARERGGKEMVGGERRRILLADDNADMRRYIARLLRGSYDVEVAVDGEAAFEAARANPPDLVLSDVMMPKLNGFGLLKALRGDERTRSLPVILISARAGDEAAVEGMDAGADDYLVKPFSTRELLARVRAHLELARQRRELERELERRVEDRTADVARLTRVLQMLSGINSALVRIPDRNEVMAEACRLASNIGGYSLAMVALLDPATRIARPVAWSGLAHHQREFPVADREGEDSSLIGRVIRTGVASSCEDIQSSPHVIQGAAELGAAGLRSLACLPLRVDGTPVGAVLFGTREGEPIRPD